MDTTRNPPIPQKLELFEYQKLGAQWLASQKHALLADKQRLGKTVQAIRAADLVLAKRILVICRAVARKQWIYEFKRWQKIDRNVYEISTGPRTPSRGVPNPPPVCVAVASFEAAKVVRTSLIGKFDVIIIDEAHYCKNPTAGRTRIIFGRGGLVHQSERVWLLTGTPMPNHAAEMWAFLYTFGLYPKTYMAFVKEYCDYFENGFGFQITGSKTDKDSVSSLKEMLNKFMLRRTESDVAIELPHIYRQETLVEASRVDLVESGCFAEELEKYGLDKLKKLISIELGIYEGIVEGTMSHMLVETLKISARSISTLRKLTALQKVDATVELIKEELREMAYEKVVIFGVHVAAIDMLKKRLSEFEPAVVYGATQDPAAEIHRFQNDPKCKVFIGNISAAGTSISLTAAHHIYFIEQSWVPGENAQAEMRCGGINQTAKTIFVRVITLANSVDAKVAAAIQRKSLEQNKIIESSKAERFEDLL